MEIQLAERILKRVQFIQQKPNLIDIDIALDDLRQLYVQLEALKGSNRRLIEYSDNKVLASKADKVDPLNDTKVETEINETSDDFSSVVASGKSEHQDQSDVQDNPLEFDSVEAEKVPDLPVAEEVVSSKVIDDMIEPLSSPEPRSLNEAFVQSNQNDLSSKLSAQSGFKEFKSTMDLNLQYLLTRYLFDGKKQKLEAFVSSVDQFGSFNEVKSHLDKQVKIDSDQPEANYAYEELITRLKNVFVN